MPKTCPGAFLGNHKAVKTFKRMHFPAAADYIVPDAPEQMPGRTMV